jgi:hypothetical protein
MEDLKKIHTSFERIIELDNSIKYIRPVFAKSLVNMFPDIDPSHDLIQFNTESD